MLKLYGMPLSNYFNMVKHALLEKGLEFEEVYVRPSQEPDFLQKSPMGKVPLLETEQGYLTETDAILDYLEEGCTGPALFPAEPFARARVRQLMKTQELYVETPAHDLIGALFGREVPAHVIENSRPAVSRGLAAISRLARFSPWIAGEQFSCADIVVFYSLTLSNRLTGLVYHWDLLDEVPGMRAWFELMQAREVTVQVMVESDAAAQALAARHAR